MREGHWADKAACKEIDTERYFADRANGRAYKDLEPLCESCPVAQFCRISSLGESEGFWAGLTPHQRLRFRTFWGISDPFGMLATEGHRVAAAAWRNGVTPGIAARDWLGPNVGNALLDWLAPLLNEQEYLLLNERQYKEEYDARQSA